MPPAALAKFSSQSKSHQQPVPNFQASPMPLPQIFEPVQDHCALPRRTQIGGLQAAVSSYKQTARAPSALESHWGAHGLLIGAFLRPRVF
jgi:hypothetical protein